MDIRSKLYPYPVVSEFNDDYKTTKFEVFIDSSYSLNNVLLSFKTEISNELIQQLIDQKKACYAFHLECPSTTYRTVLKTFNNKAEIRIDSKKLKNILQICPFIVVTKEIKEYSNPDFNDDFFNLSFDLDEGNIIATGTPFSCSIENEQFDYSNIPSIFDLIQNKDEKITSMEVEMEGNNICVKIPYAVFDRYDMINNSPEYLSVLHSMTIIPALIFVLERLAFISSKDESLNDYEVYTWYRVLRKKIEQLFNCDIEDALKNYDSIFLAQKFLDNPFSKALQSLSFAETDQEDE